MRIFRIVARILFILALSLSLGGAATARVFHEVQAPGKVYLSGEGDGSIIQLCDSKQILNHQGAPVKIGHIHACGACIATSAAILSLDPVTPIAFVLIPSKAPLYFPEPVVDWAAVPPAAPQTAHAPPSFS